jgi:hypothetical protein
MLAGVNYLGHVDVGLATGRGDDLFVLGTALPDLASMAGVRLDRSRLDPAVRAGVDCHLLADTAFHDHPAFREGSAALRRDVAAAGLGTGPAPRHRPRRLGAAPRRDPAGLGDGGRLPAGAGRGAEVSGAMDADGAGRWGRLLASGPPPRLRYDDPTWVAERLVAMLGRRPRLAVPADRVAAVAAVLADHVDAVRAVAPGVLADVAAAVRR